MLKATIILLGTAVLLASSVDSDGQSQHQSPSSQQPSAQNTQQPAADQRGTEQSPLSVKILPALDADKKAADEKRERDEKAIIDKKLAFETQRIADYTFWLSLVTLAMGSVTGYLAYQTGVAAKAARDAAEHIPRVERAYLFGGPCRITVNDERTITFVKLTVDNPGRTPGILKVVCAKMSLNPPNGNEPNYAGLDRREVDMVINSSNGLNPTDPANAIILPIDIRSDSIETQYVWGFYEYIDIFHRTHTSRFSTRVFPLSGKYQQFGAPAWNSWA